MSRSSFSRFLASRLLAFAVISTSVSTMAGGPVGEHVTDLDAHLDEYAGEVSWLMEQVGGVVDSYAEGGISAANTADIPEFWEAVKFHAAIESNYLPLYANIWQGLFGVSSSIEAGKSIDEVRAEEAKLHEALWQSLGAVKMASQVQAKGYQTAQVTADSLTPVDTLAEIQTLLDRVVAKYAEKLSDEAIAIVQDTYLTRFEGVEGALIEQDANLVEDLEIDFNVTLPKAIEDGQSVDAVREVVIAMQGKLDTASALLAASEASRSSVF